MLRFQQLQVRLLLLICLLDISAASGSIEGYRLYSDRRAQIPARRRRNGVPSAQVCAKMCKAQRRFKCTMFTLRVRGMRCMMYNDADVKSIQTSNFEEEFANAIGFFTYALEQVLRDQECLPDDDPIGESYEGTKSRTTSGKVCQRWNVESPHRPTFQPSGPVARHRNYCRNPDGDSGGLWCYTKDPDKRWEYCNVPNCNSEEVEETEDGVEEAGNGECFLCNGLNYRGSVNRTKSGKTCQRWDASSPHQHSNHPNQKPGKHLDKNFCRNPDGDVMPWCYTTDKSKRWEYCQTERCTNPDGGIVMPNVRYTTDCVEGKGGNYRGTISRTRSGKTCAQWSAQVPHKHTRTPENYPCSGLDSNHCRNPTGSFDEGVWCYTTDKNVRWELCEVPKCGPNGRPVTTTTTTTIATAASPTPRPGTCGVQAVQPSFMTQSFNIEDSRVVETRRTKREAVTFKGGQQERILGGDIAVHGSWPWSVSIRYYDQHFCGGTLVAKQWILTAAHCFDDAIRASDFAIKVGHHKGTEPQLQMQRVRRYIIAERYRKQKVQDDIAMIEVVSPFVINDYVRLACFPQPDYIVPAGSFCVVTGWGKTYDPKYQNELKQAVLPVHSYRDCLRYLGRNLQDKTQMCAGWKGKGHDTCRGDSGGPLVCLNNQKWTVQGVTSWGSGCESKKGSYGSYTRVSKYLSWIQEKMRS